MKFDMTQRDEFLLSRLLDGDLAVEEAAMLRGRIEREPQLRECFTRMQRIETLVAGRRSRQPVVDYERLCRDVMAEVVKDQSAITEDEEYQLSLLLDGDLGSGDETQLRERIAGDAGLRHQLDGMARVENLLITRRSEQPEVDYASLHQAVMAKVTAEPKSAFRIIRFPVWLRVAAPLAAAAIITLAVWLHPGQVPGGHNPSDAGGRPDLTGPIAQNPVVKPAGQPENSDVPANTMFVQVNRPSLSGSLGSAQVSYVRSSQLDEAVRKMDAERQNQPARTLYFAPQARPDTPVRVEVDVF